MRSLWEQGVALADGVARVHLHRFGFRLEAGALDADRVAAGLDRVFDQWRLTGIDPVDVDLAERVRRDGKEALRLDCRRRLPRLRRRWPARCRYANGVLNPYRVDERYRCTLLAPFAPHHQVSARACRDDHEPDHRGSPRPAPRGCSRLARFRG